MCTIHSPYLTWDLVFLDISIIQGSPERKGVHRLPGDTEKTEAFRKQREHSVVFFPKGARTGKSKKI